MQFELRAQDRSLKLQQETVARQKNVYKGLYSYAEVKAERKQKAII